MLGKLLAAVDDWIDRRYIDPDHDDHKKFRGETITVTEIFTDQRNSLERADKRRFFPGSVQASYAKKLAEISQACHAMEIECVFLTQPNGYRGRASAAIKKSFWMTPPYETYTVSLELIASIAALYNSHLIEFGERNGHRVIDLAAVVQGEFEHFYDDVHFNAKGARRVAEIVGDGLIRAMNWPIRDIAAAPHAKTDARP